MTKTILVIDDEPQFERLVGQRFRKEIKGGKYRLIFAENGQRALELLETYPEIAIVLTDINMPIMDGLTFLTNLRAIRPQLKAIVISAYGDMDNIRKAMNLGAFDFVTKPIDFTDLKITIEKTLEETRLIADAERAKELEIRNEELLKIEKLKSQFFTDISHELRTPLSIITSVTKQMREDPIRWGKYGMELIQRNGNHLLDLANQILDLRKLEVGKLRLQLLQGDLISFCQYIVSSFSFLAHQSSLQLHFLPQKKTWVIDFDQNKLLRILSNLITNAIKNTSAGGYVYILVEARNGRTNQVSISIKDTGKGISENELPLIFERFYRPSSNKTAGTGVGLALVKELVQLMEGEIEVESELGEGSTFSIHLPITQNAALSERTLPFSPESELALQNAQVQPAERPTEEIDENLPTLLIVEDNEDIIQHLLISIGYLYQTIIAYDGKEGIEKALLHIPDIIISDIIMPEKDGFALCETLKTDERTSHIPIVLLTGKVDQDSRIKGLSRGADAYLNKPFDPRELRIVVARLIQQRNELRERYSQLHEEVSGSSTPKTDDFSLEDAFLLRARQLVEDHLQDNQFSVQRFCSGLGMSYSVIHRKLAVLSGKSPALFIRTVRLQWAKKLLSDQSKTISEIAYDTGFNDPKYFSRVFSEEYGAPPSVYR